MIDEIHVQFAEPSDIEGVLGVVSTTFPQDFDYGSGFDRDQARVFFQRVLEDPNEILIVAKRVGEILGFAYYINKPPTNGTVILEMIGVNKKFQGKGIGLKLLSEGDALAVSYIKEGCGVKNLATIHLTTSGDNVVGQNLYLKGGYRHVGDIPGFVGEGNLELVMLKKVADVKYREGLWSKGD